MSTLSPAWIGAAVGLAFAIVDNLLIHFMLREAHQKGEPANEPLLRGVGGATVFFFPLVGYLVGPMVVN
ncbi:MAG: hypothetical protein KGO53_06115 [Alphaproteobacteria bacterium]|nr:hypothetical protein [Alphaproteobacteria bacterium]